MKGLIFLLIFGLMTSSALYAVNPVLDVVQDESGLTVIDNAEQGGWWYKTKSFVAKTFNKVVNFLEETSGKTIAIIAHIGLIGTIIAYFMNQEQKNSLASFYIRQNLGLFIVGAVLSLAIRVIGFGLAVAGVSSFLTLGFGIISLILFIFWIMSLLGALKGEEKLTPLFGKMFQNWFKGI